MVFRRTLGKAGLTLALAACSSQGSPPSDYDPSVVAAPPTGQGFQFHTEEFEVPALTEVQDCYFYRARDLALLGGLDPESPFYLHRVQIAQRDGSHHMNLFRVRTIHDLDPSKGPVVRGRNGQGPCFASGNWGDWPLIANTQQDGELDWTYPDGVASEFLPDEWIMLQTHFVNATTQKTNSGKGEVVVNFWTMPKSEVRHQLGTLFATKQSIRVCQKNPSPAFDGACQFKSPEPVTIIGANAHFHGRGKDFSLYAWNGTSTEQPADASRFYLSKTWDDPPMARSPELSITIPAGGGVWYNCSYNWQPPPKEIGCEGLNAFDGEKYKTPKEAQDCCYTFGPQVDRNEHCNIFVYYYPKRDDVNCF